MSFLTPLRAAFKGGAQGWGRSPETSSRPVNGRSSAAARGYRSNTADGVGSASLSDCDAKARALVVPTSAGQSLLKRLAARLLLHGNAFVQTARDGAGKPVELFALRPERVSMIPDADGWPAAYAHTIGDRKLTIPVEDEQGWPNLIHLKGYHPADDHRSGVEPFTARQRRAALGARWCSPPMTAAG